MENYLETLSEWMNQPQYLLIILIGVYFVAGTIDFIVGTFNAIYTEEIEFSSRIAQIGIMRKLVTLVVMILVVPLALILPLDIATYSLTVLYVGVAGSEIYSILGHIGIVKDGEKHKALIGTLFNEIIGSAINKK